MSLLDHILRQGDRVRMNMDYETRSYRPNAVPNGTLGTIAGRFRAIGIYEHRYPAPYKRQPGIYSKDGVPLVVWDEYPDGVDPMNPDYMRTSASHLDAADTFFKEYQQRYATEWAVRNADGTMNRDFDTSVQADKLDNMERTGDLPDSAFWELDIVSYRREKYRIRRISYFGWGSQGVNGAGETCYDMEGIDENGEYDRGGSTTVAPSNLILVERGNVWREAHGEQPIFRSLAEEASYATAMGRSHEVRNPANDLYSWTLEETLQAIKDDIVDGFSNGVMLFSDQRRISATRFDDRDLGNRVRQTTLVGFNTPVPA